MSDKLGSKVGSGEQSRPKSLVRQLHLSPDEVTLEPPAERDNEKLSGPLGARRVLQEDQARHGATEIPRKTRNLEHKREEGEEGGASKEVRNPV